MTAPTKEEVAVLLRELLVEAAFQRTADVIPTQDSLVAAIDAAMAKRRTMKESDLLELGWLLRRARDRIAALETRVALMSREVELKGIYERDLLFRQKQIAALERQLAEARKPVADQEIAEHRKSVEWMTGPTHATINVSDLQALTRRGLGIIERLARPIPREPTEPGKWECQTMRGCRNPGLCADSGDCLFHTDDAALAQPSDPQASTAIFKAGPSKEGLGQGELGDYPAQPEGEKK